MAEANPHDIILPEIEEFGSKIQNNMAEHIHNPLAQRSAKQVTIFLYGKSGDGKSSTLNHLFGTDIIPTRKGRSETRIVTEYGCSFEESQIEEKLIIGFIDSPGFDDTEGEDAENLARISYFIGTHPELGNSKQQVRVYPNIVLIVISASDERLSGIYSIFSKMLHVLSKLNVVDRLHPNVVIAVTHAMHFSSDEYIVGTKYIKEICRILTRAHFSFEPPVMFIENLDIKKEMKQEGDWLILPDGTRQPLNLFEAMIHLMKQSGDEVGVKAVRLLFSESKKYKVCEMRSIPRDFNPKDFAYTWEKIIEEKFFLKKQSEIYKIVSKHIDSDSIRIFPFSYNLQKKNMVNAIEFSNHQLTDIQQLLIPYKFTAEEEEWLIHLLEVSLIKMEIDLKLLGRGYSKELKEIRNRILQLGPLEIKKIGNYEIKIPQACSIKEMSQNLIDVNVNVDEITKWFRANEFRLTFRICYVLFQVEIDNTENFDPVFISTLKQSFSKEKYHETFFKSYSEDCTTLLSFGGYISGKLDFPFDEKVDKELPAEFSSQLEAYFSHIKNGAHPHDVPLHFSDKLQNALKECKVTWNGGNKEFHSEKLLDVTVDSWNAWTSSIHQNIVCLDQMIKFMSQYTILLNSPDEEIRSFAPQFVDEPIEELVSNNDSSVYIQNIEAPINGHSQNNQMPVLTRIDASRRNKNMCVLL